MNDTKIKNWNFGGPVYGGQVASLCCLSILSIMPNVVTAAERGGIEEVIVTAQKRSQSIQDVSVSITAFTAESIRDLGINRPRDLARVTPGLVMNASAISEADPIFTLRGIGMNDPESNQNPSVTPYLDEVALPSHVMLGFQIFDVERVEVLKGPQGTLYGRNTTGGAVKFISNKPTRELAATSRLDFGNYDRIEFEGAIGGPLTDTLSGRIGAMIVSQDGWQTLRLGPDSGPGVGRENGDVDRKSLRGSLLWEPSSDFNMLLTLDAGTDDSEVLAFEHAGNLLQDGSGFCSFAITGVRDESQCASFAQERDDDRNALTPELELVADNDGDARAVDASFSLGNEIDAESWGFSAVLNWEMERFTITSVTGYRDFEREQGGDNGSPFVISDNFRDVQIDGFSQEVRLTSDNSWGSLKWLIGAYYSEDSHDDFVFFDFRDHSGFSADFDSAFTQDTEDLAIFSQAEWDINEQWRLIGGLRYTWEDKEFTFDGERRGFGPPNPVSGYEDSLDTSEVSGKIGVDYTPSEDLLIYASVNRGFKGAGYPATIAFDEPQLAPFEPEVLISYELGFKSTLADNKIRLNAAAYFYDWQDFQAATAVERDGLRLIVLANAGDAEVTGIEAEFAWYPIEEFSFNLGFNWMDAEIVSGEFDGDTPAHTPEFMYSGIARYESAKPLIGKYHPFVQIDFSYQDDIEFILANHPGATETDYTLTNARAGIRTGDRKWEFAAWGRNLGDKDYRSEVFGPGSGFLPGRIHYGAPRTYGVSLNYSY